MQSIGNPQRILIICIRYLGDTFLLRPVLRALRTKYPKTHITALVTAGTEVGLDRCTDLDQIIGWPRKKFFQEAKTTLKIISQKYDWAIDFTGNDRSAFIAFISGAKIRAGYYRPKQPWYSFKNQVYNVRPVHEKKKPHIVLQRLKLLEACGVPGQGIEISLQLDPKAMEVAEQFYQKIIPKKVVHAHLSSRDMQKSLPVQLVRQVFSALVQADIGIVCSAGQSPQEQQYLAECLAENKKQIYPATHFTWPQLVALIARSDFYWGVDTAPAHVASALHKPMLVHYGPSHVQQWQPLNPEAEILASNCECLQKKNRICPASTSGKCFQTLSVNLILEKILTKVQPILTT